MKTISEPHIIHNPALPKNFAPDFLEIKEGKGCRLTDTGGKEYLDFGSGIAVNALGYGKSHLAQAAAAQMEKVIHTSNLYITEATRTFARQLVTAPTTRDMAAPPTAVHFGSSGTEANEAALKYARLYALRRRGPGHHKILSFTRGFHGRTLGALSVTAKEKYRAPYEPLIPGAVILPFNDTAALEAALDDSFAAVMVEPLQGEGGINPLDPAFAARLRELCRKHDVLLIADEVQTGLGRTGSLFASRQINLLPDIITLAKPLAAGLPLSATLIPAKVNDLLHPGDHGTTFGGGPVTCAVASLVLSEINSPEFLAEVDRKGRYLAELLEKLAAKYSFLGTPRGWGLLRGLPLLSPSGEPPAAAGPSGAPHPAAPLGAVMKAARDRGLLILTSGDNVLRFAPPLVISDEELAEGVDILEDSLTAVFSQP